MNARRMFLVSGVSILARVVTTHYSLGIEQRAFHSQSIRMEHMFMQWLVRVVSPLSAAHFIVRQK